MTSNFQSNFNIIIIIQKWVTQWAFLNVRSLRKFYDLQPIVIFVLVMKSYIGIK